MMTLIWNALLLGTLTSPQSSNSVSALQSLPSASEQTPAAYCPVDSFKACGGDLEGTWSLKAHCTEPGEVVPCEFPFDGEAACQSVQDTVQCQLDVSGSMTFSKGKVRMIREEQIAARYTLSNACTAAVRADAGDAKARCESLSRAPLMTCTFADDLCSCDSKISGDPMDETVSYTTQGANLSFGEFQANYCASGEDLTLDFSPHPQSWRYWVLRR